LGVFDRCAKRPEEWFTGWIGAAADELRRMCQKGGRLNRETALDESEQKVLDVVWMKEVKRTRKRRLE